MSIVTPPFSMAQFGQPSTSQQGQPWTYIVRTAIPEKASASNQAPSNKPPASGSISYYCEPFPDYYMPPRIYGDTLATARRLLTSYMDRTDLTGVLLVGDKGSGKTLMMKVISQVARDDHHLPTVIVNEGYYGDDFNLFIRSLPPCVILFDEFEKVYRNYAAQEALLTLYDGLFSSKKLMVHTANSENGINNHFLNRPGRLMYRIRYGGMEEAAVREYCGENLINKTHTDELVKIAAIHQAFSFDMLKALVEEMNRYNEPPKKAIKLLNITPGSDVNYRISLKLADGTEIPEQYIYPRQLEGNPYLHTEIRIGWRLPSNVAAPGSDSMGNYILTPSDTNLTVDETGKVYTHRADDGLTVTLARVSTVTREIPY